MISLKLKFLGLLFPGDFSQNNTCRLKTQTSGKRKFLCLKTEGKILKPYPKHHPVAEEEFYRWVNVQDDSSTSPDIKKLVPQFYGSFVTAHFRCLVLEDISSSFKCPSIADIKIGARTWSPSDCFLKVAKEIVTYPLGRSLGFRITGAKMFVHSSKTFKNISFWTIRSLSRQNLMYKVIAPFFSFENGTLRLNVIREVLLRLAIIKEWFEKHNDRFKFVSSSVLITLENSLDVKDSCKVDVRMIDFAHVMEYQSERYLSSHTNDSSLESSRLDSNYLYGLCNFINFLALLLPTGDAPSQR